MTRGVSVSVDRIALGKAVDEITLKQVPFATAVAMTRSARDGVEATRESVKRKYFISKKGLLSRFRSIRADKKDWPDLVAAVGSLDSFWNDQEYGAVRKPRSGGTLAVPTRLAKPRKRRAITKSKRPKSLIAKGRARAAPRTIRKKRTTRRDRREIYYFRIGSARIKPTMGATRLLQETYVRVFPSHYKRELEIALRSRNVRGHSFSTGQGRFEYLKAQARVG